MEDTVVRARAAVLQLIEAGDNQEAAERAKSSLGQFPDDGLLVMMLGVSLVQLGQIELGTVELKKATELAPSEAETFHNLALALCRQGDFREAEIYAREALKIDPEHPGAASTLELCGQGESPSEFSIEDHEIEPSELSERLGPDDLQVHVLHLGEAWTKIGFGMVGYCVLSFTFLIFHPFFNGSAMRPDPLSKLSFFLYVTSGLGTVIWTLIDVIDRREKFVWLLPMWVCGFPALSVLPLTLYLALRRKMVQMR